MPGKIGRTELFHNVNPEHFVPSFKPAKVFVEKVKNGNVTKLAAAAEAAKTAAEV